MTSARHLAIVPARGGSRGLREKNLRKVQGLSLTARAVALAGAVPEIAEVIVSTDSPEIQAEAERAGALVPFLRPEHLAQDTTPMVEVLRHAWRWYRANRQAAAETAIVLLQPTSPMRRVADIRNAIAAFEWGRQEGRAADVVQTVSTVPAAHRPNRLYRIDSEGRPVVAGLPEPSAPLVFRNGAAIVLNPERLEALTLAHGRTVGVCNDEPLVSIDDWSDLLRAEHCGRSLEPPEASK